MGLKKIRKKGHCERCNYTWPQRKSNPKACPRCHSYHWRTKRPPIRS